MNYDDPKLTTYALGELHEAERAEVEAQLNDEARAFVAETQAFAARLEAELKSEPLPDLTSQQKDAITARGQRKVVAFPPRVKRWVLTSSAVAACLLIGAFYALTPAFVQKKAMVKGQVKSQESPFEFSTLPKIALASPEVEKPASDDSYVTLDKEFTLPPGAPLVATGPGVNLPVPAGTPFGVLKPEESRLDQTLGDFRLLAGRGATQSSGSRGAVSATEAPRPETAPARALAGLDHSAKSDIRGYSDGWNLGRGMTANPVVSAGNSDFNTETYDAISDNPFLRVEQNPLSTFSIDVDTASYSNVRRFLTSNTLPPKDAVRIEELVNYFRYQYPQPKNGDPFSVTVDIVPAPWKTEHKLVRVGLKGREVAEKDRAAANLVFLIDVSGSMNQPAKLPLVKESMNLLLGKLRPEDRVAIVVYAGASGLVLPSTEAARKNTILSAIEQLRPGGSTNGEAGIQLAYDIAKANFVKGGNNRVILATDGDFNVGVTNQGDLVRLVEEKAKSGVFLTVAGFGMGNYKDSMLETLSNQGNGNYAYIDNRREAEKTFVEQIGGTLETIAKDVKIQVEFNPAHVGAFRLIGYENRILRHEDFNDDRKDAGDIGSGHMVTALYELIPAGADATLPGVDPLRYQQPPAKLKQEATSSEWLTVKLRYKQPEGDTSKLTEVPVNPRDDAKAGTDMEFASSVAAFGMILRDSPHKGNATWKMVLDLAENGLGTDELGYRNEFISLVRKAETISANQ